jgi:hypothetical protein
VDIGHLGDAEVDDLGHVSARPVGHDEDVRGLDVAMDDALRMRGRERARDRQEHLDRLLRRHPAPPLQPAGERHALEELHHQERLAGFGLSEIEHAHDRRMAEPRRRARLPEQALGGVDIEALLVEHLDRHIDVEPQAARPPHRPHAPDAQPANDLVLAGEDVARGALLLRQPAHEGRTTARARIASPGERSALTGGLAFVLHRSSTVIHLS